MATEQIPPQAYTVRVIAGLFDVDTSRIRQLEKAGAFQRTGKFTYDLVTTVKGYIAHLRARIPGADLPHSSMGEQNLRLVTAKADLAEMEAKRLAGELLPSAEVAKVWADAVTRFRQRALAIPSKAAPLCAVEAEPDACHAIVETFIHEALAELAATDVQVDGEPGGARRPAQGRVSARRAAAEADGERVGGSVSETQLGE